MKAALFKTSLICPCLLSPPKAHYLDKVVKGMALLLSLSFLLLFRSVSHHFPITSSFKCICTAALKLIFTCHLTPVRHNPQPIRAFPRSQYSITSSFHLAPVEWLAREPERPPQGSLCETFGLTVLREGGQTAGRGPRRSVACIMDAQCSCVAEIREGRGDWVRRGSEATSSLIKACHAPVMSKPQPPTPPSCSFSSSFILVSGFLAL